MVDFVFPLTYVPITGMRNLPNTHEDTTQLLGMSAPQFVDFYIFLRMGSNCEKRPAMMLGTTGQDYRPKDSCYCWLSINAHALVGSQGLYSIPKYKWMFLGVWVESKTQKIHWNEGAVHISTWSASCRFQISWGCKSHPSKKWDSTTKSKKPFGAVRNIIPSRIIPKQKQLGSVSHSSPIKIPWTRKTKGYSIRLYRSIPAS